LTPLIQRWTVSLPPALTIVSQIFMGIWMGSIGVVFATPLTVVLMVLVKKLYVEHYLGDTGEERQASPLSERKA
jgi:predicted PurR-regulated permease PerM